MTRYGPYPFEAPLQPQACIQARETAMAGGLSGMDHLYLYLHPRDAKNLYRWDMKDAGWEWKTEAPSGKHTRFGNIIVIKDSSIEPGHLYFEIVKENQ